MRIYSMTATFGKLEHKTLTLKPGLNIIQAPNEWGKSTWCAFLLAMLYGMETRVHSTKTALADKERYAPWSGSPMSGRMDIYWQGKDITIERRSKGRGILSEFSAYETASGLPVPQLTATNCGQMLLGIERSVFIRSGFLRLTDLPVTQDEALRRRLNALVTTGDESGAADNFEQKLKELKNRCKFNRTGLLPQAQAQYDTLREKLQHIRALENQKQSLQENLLATEAAIADLKNHRLWLEYTESRQNQEQLTAARAAVNTAKLRRMEAEAAAASLPDKETALHNIQALQQLQSRASAAKIAESAQSVFSGMTEKAAQDMVQKDIARYNASRKPQLRLLSAGLTVLALGAGTAAIFGSLYWLLAVSVVLLAGAGCLMLVDSHKKHACQADLLTKYGCLYPQQWLQQAEQFGSTQHDLTQIQADIRALTVDRTPEEALNYWQSAITVQQSVQEADAAYIRAVDYYHLVASVVKPAVIPTQPDTLHYSMEQTNAMIDDAVHTQKQLQLQYGQCMGQIQQLGSTEQLQAQLDAVSQRIERLEKTLSAITIAQNTLAEARAQLQRRFAPKITQRAQDLFAQLTGQRYNRMTLGDDFTIQAGAQDEDTLRTAMWRSEGTVDQLYLALRLAVAAELAPEAPLILDDALVRFDDTRHAAAMALLQQESSNKQIILFSCQSRESAYL